MKILYKCDGNRKCYGKGGCGLTNEEGPCRHTASPKHAERGAVDHPEQYPGRFVEVAPEVYVEL